MLFTEGYLSSHADEAIRDELCQEALRLCGILCEHSVGRTPESFALMALMHLHHARLRGRIDGAGGLLLLEEQDRSRWDAAEIALGLTWLERSASGDSFSRYHAEAAIAAEHCIAPTFAATSWQRVSENYLLLEGYAPSPLHRLNRAIAVAQWKGPEAGLEVLAASAPPTWLEGSYLWSAVLADLHRRAGHASEASRFAEAALALAPSPSVAELLRRRLRGEKREPSEEG